MRLCMCVLTENKIDMPDHVKAILAQPSAPKREHESPERTERIRSRFEALSQTLDAVARRGVLACGGVCKPSVLLTAQHQAPAALAARPPKGGIQRLSKPMEHFMKHSMDELAAASL